MDKRKRVLRKIIAGFVIILVLLTFFSKTINNFSLPRVRVEAASSGSLFKEIAGQGTVQAKDTVDFYITSSLKVLDLYVQQGDKVTQGQKVAQLDVKDLEKNLQDERSRLNQQQISLEKSRDTTLQVLNADKSISQALKRVEDAQSTFDSINNQHSNGQATDAQLSSAQRDLDNARADYNIAVESKAKLLRDNSRDMQNSQEALNMQKRRVEDLEKQIADNGVITAAKAGTIVELNFAKGTMANNSHPFYKLSNTSAGFELKVTVNAANIDYLNTGDDVDVTLTNLNNKTVKGKLSKILDNVQGTPAQSGQQAATQQARKDLYIDINDSSLSGGETATIDIIKKTKSYNVLIPNEAVYLDDSGKFIYITKEVKGPLGRETRLQKISIFDEDSDFAKTAVTSGLNKGDKIVTSTTKPLSSGGSVIVSGQ